jgi:hypothetical protein
LGFEYSNKKRSSNRSDIQQPANDAAAGELLFQSNCLAWRGVDSARNPVLYKLHHLILVIIRLNYIFLIISKLLSLVSFAERVEGNINMLIALDLTIFNPAFSAGKI